MAAAGELKPVMLPARKLAASLRKGSDTFHRLDNGRWGLQAWYGNVRRRHARASQPAEQTEPEADDLEEEDEGNDQPAKASVSLMITQEQKAQLRQRGFTDEQIREMKPTEAHRELGLAADADEASTAA